MSETTTTEAPTPAPEAPQSDDLRDVIGAAWDAAEKVEQPGTAERDERGRFKAAETDEPAAAPAQAEAEPAAVSDPPEPEIAAPDGWSDADKAHWAEMPKAAREAVLRRESEIQAALEQASRADRDIEPVRAAVDRYRAQFVARGIAPEQAIAGLFEAQAMLDRNPLEGLRALAQSYRVDLAQLATSPQQQPAEAPVIAQMQEKIRELEAQVQRREVGSMQAEIDKFAATHEHFAEVRGHMGALMQAELAKSMDEAYAMAVRAHPEVSRKIAAAEAKAAEDARRKTAAEARAKAVQVHGAAPANVAAQTPDTIRGALLAAWDEAS